MNAPGAVPAPPARGAIPDVVLGLCAFTPGCAAALLIGGRLVAFVEEERLTGEKGTTVYPDHAVEWVLSNYGLTPGRVTAVAFNSNLAAISSPAALMRSMAGSRAPRTRSLLRSKAAGKEQLASLSRRFPLADVHGVRDELAHALYSHLASGSSRSAVLVVDGARTGVSTSIHVAEGSWLRPVLVQREPNSLSCAHGAIAQHLRLRGGEEATLASAGDPARFRPVLRSAIRLHGCGVSLSSRSFIVDKHGPGSLRVSKDFVGLTHLPRDVEGPLEQNHADLAAALQERTDEALVHLASLAMRLTGESRLCVAGGLAVEPAGLGGIIATGAFEEVVVPPAPGDSGTAIGAAAEVARRRGPLQGFDRSEFLGPSYGVERIARVTAAAGLHARWVEDPAPFLAGQLAAGRIVGVFQGRAESGPQAAGNRSILASPLVAGMTDRINKGAKLRKRSRIVRVVVLASRAREWFELEQDFPFVSIAVRTTPQASVVLAEVVAPDGLARVQTADRRRQALLAATLEAFEARTGVPVLATSSLNITGEPIGATPEMALHCFERAGGLDGLLLENWWVER